MIETLNPSRQVLDETPARALTFLRAAGTSQPIRSALATRGYTKAEHDRGWSLVLRASGFSEGGAVTADLDVKVAEAATAVDGWDEPNFDIISTALAFHFPKQHEFLFQSDLKPARGAASIVTVETMLNRLDELENGKDRKSTRKQDHEALALLAQRGITKDERTRMRGLLHIAKEGTKPAAAPAPDPAQDKAREARDAALRELYFWYKGWAAVARAVIKRGDYLVRLGLRNRASASENGAEEPATNEPAPSPAETGQAVVAPPVAVVAGKSATRGRGKKK